MDTSVPPSEDRTGSGAPVWYKETRVARSGRAFTGGAAVVGGGRGAGGGGAEGAAGDGAAAGFCGCADTMRVSGAATAPVKAEKSDAKSSAECNGRFSTKAGGREAGAAAAEAVAAKLGTGVVVADANALLLRARNAGSW